MTARNQSRRTYAWTIPTSKTHNARTVWILNILVPFHRQSRADNGHSPSGRLCGTAKAGVSAASRIRRSRSHPLRSTDTNELARQPVCPSESRPVRHPTRSAPAGSTISARRRSRSSSCRAKPGASAGVLAEHTCTSHSPMAAPNARASPNWTRAGLVHLRDMQRSSAIGHLTWLPQGGARARRA